MFSDQLIVFSWDLLVGAVHMDTNSSRRIGSSVLPSPYLPQKARFCRLACLKTALASYHVTESKVDTTDIFYGDDVVSQPLSSLLLVELWFTQWLTCSCRNHSCPAASASHTAQSRRNSWSSSNLIETPSFPDRQTHGITNMFSLTVVIYHYKLK